MRRAVRWGTVLVLLGMIGVPALLRAPAAAAQLPVQLWLRPALALPVGAFAGREGGVEAEPGFGFDAGGAARLGALTLYAEYQEVNFGCEECSEAGLEDDVLDRGWGAGVMVPLPFGGGVVRPWGKAGVIGHHLRFRLDDAAAYSDSSLGWSAGLGADVRPTRWLRVEPSAVLRSYDARFGFTIDVPDRTTSVTYLALGLSLVIGP